MCWTGEQGSQGYAMTQEESISAVSRLSLTGKLRRAIIETSERFGCYGFIPYYEWEPAITAEKVLPQISLQSFLDQHGIPQERVLSILLKKL